MFQKKKSPMHYTFTDIIAVAAFSVISVIVTVNGGMPQKALFSIEPAGAPKDVRSMSISQRTYVDVDHWGTPASNSINFYGSTAWLRGGPSPALKLEAARLSGLASEFFNPYGTTAWARGNSSVVGKAEASRLSGLAGEFINPFGSTVWLRYEPSEVMLSQEDIAEAIQLQALAGDFLPGISQAEMTEAVRLHALIGGFESAEYTIAARLLAAGKAYGIIPHNISVELASFSDQ